MNNGLSLALIVVLAVVIIIFLIAVIISVKFNKKTTFNAQHKESNFGFSIEAEEELQKNKSDNNLPVVQVSSSKTQDHLKMAMFQTLKTHFLFSTGFGLLLFEDDISDKVYIKYFKKLNVVDKAFLDKLDICDKYIEYLFKNYVNQFKAISEKLYKSLVDDLCLEKEYPVKLERFNNFIDEFLANLAEEKYAKACVSNFKSTMPVLVLRDRQKHQVTEENLDKDILQEFCNKTEAMASDLIHDVRMSISSIVYSDTPITQLYSILTCVTHIYDSIQRYLFSIQFQGKVSMLGRCLGV